MNAIQIHQPDACHAAAHHCRAACCAADAAALPLVLKGRLLGPGDWAVEEAPGLLGSVVGSSVCITLWSATERVGAMCHFQLPRRAAPPVPLRCGSQETPNAVDCETERARSGCDCDARYGDEAFALMCKALLDRGVDPQLCEAKIFGGGQERQPPAGQPADVAQRNVASAFALVSEHGIRLGGFHVGRHGQRRIWFNVATGLVDLRFEAAGAPRPATRLEAAGCA